MVRSTPTDAVVEKRLVTILRKGLERYLALPNVTSFGIGYKITEGNCTDRLCIQFTVDQKLSPHALQIEGIEVLPEVIDDDNGVEIPVDVIEAGRRQRSEVLQARSAPQRSSVPAGFGRRPAAQVLVEGELTVIHEETRRYP